MPDSDRYTHITVDTTLTIPVQLRVRIEAGTEEHEVIRVTPGPRTVSDWLKLAEEQAAVTVDERVAAEIERIQEEGSDE